MPNHAGALAPKRTMMRLPQPETMALISQIGYGRLVFSSGALPAISTFNHLVDGDQIIIRTHTGGTVARMAAAGGAIVTYQADDIDPQQRLGWTAVVTGHARIVQDTRDVTRYTAALVPWVDKPNETVIRIEPENISGFRLA